MPPIKALVCDAFGSIDDLTVKDITLAELKSGQVAIEVRSAGVNFPDALMVQGLYQEKPPFPFVAGAEVAGVISAIASDVTNYKIGDEVIAFIWRGGFAQACVADSHSIMPLPKGMSFDMGAAFMLTYATSLHALKDVGNLQEGETIAILGASGGVGSAAIEIAKAMGAKVIACASSAQKLDLCQSVGADELINYCDENLKERLAEICGKSGVDVVYDAVGGAHTEAALRALAWRGRLLVVGFASGSIPSLPLNLALLKERQILGVYWGDSVRRDPKGHMKNVEQLLGWFAQGKIKPYVSAKFSLDQAKAALKLIAGRGVLGKIVINPN